MKVKEEKGKFWLKTQQSENKDHGICYHHSWEIDGETVETVRDFNFLDPQISADGATSMKLKGACSLEEKL